MTMTPEQLPDIEAIRIGILTTAAYEHDFQTVTALLDQLASEDPEYLSAYATALQRLAEGVATARDYVDHLKLRTIFTADQRAPHD